MAPPSFNILDYRLPFQMPERLTEVDSWHTHIPFAFFAVEELRPDVLVELGTWKGDSYCAFAQAVATLGLPTRCFAVDTWAGDAHTGPYNGTALEELKRHHDARYAAFSTLLQMTFDEALERFQDGSVDLLHIDGCHHYEAVSHDFQAWLPKLSPRGVVLFHDTAEHVEEFGVWKLWEELSGEHSCFDFRHGHGLGVLAIGPEVDEHFLDFLEQASDSVAIPDLFRSLGERIWLHGQGQRLTTEVQVNRELLAELERQHEDQVEWLDRQLTAARDALRKSEEALDKVRLSQHLERNVLKERDEALAAVYRSASWRLTRPLRATKDRLRRSTLARRTYVQVRSVRRETEPSETSRSTGPRSTPPRTYNPLVSVLLPVFDTEPELLRRAAHSVLRQTYSNWELCVCDDGSTLDGTRAALEDLRQLDGRIRVSVLEQNSGISAATNHALTGASGEFIAFIDHDDELAPEALDEFVAALNDRPDTDVLYSDEDKLDARGRHREPHLKPDWSPEFFRGVMYVGHLLLVRRRLLEEVGGLDSAFDGVQDYELMLRLSERTSRIGHVPKVLYHWRAVGNSLALRSDAKSNIEALQAAAVNAHLVRCGVPAVARPNPNLPHRVELHPHERPEWPSVSIVIPTKDAPEAVGRCLRSLFAVTDYPDFEVIVVDSGTTDPDALNVLRSSPIRLLELDRPFNFSRANNMGVASARGHHVILLNNDTEVVRPDWIQTLVWHVELQGVGAVGPLLVFEDGTVQHAGVVLGARGTADHVMLGFPSDEDGYAGSLSCTREVSAVTAACMIVPKDVYAGVGGLSEDYRTHYQDVDFCLRLRRQGLSVLFTPRTRIVHDQGVSRGDYYDLVDRALLLDVWGEVIRAGDPYYNQQLSRERLDYSLAS